MSQYFSEINRREFFNPSLLGVFTNPYFFIKGGIYHGLKANAPYMKGILLDFGCGQKPYRNLFDVTTYVGLDLQESGHDHRNSEMDLFYDGATIPFADGVFDSVLSVEVFEHVFNLEVVVGELFRVMKPGAHMLITLPFVWEEHEIPHDYARYASFGIADLLTRKGFEIVKLDKTGTYVITLVQLWNVYVSQYILPGKTWPKALLVALTIAPMTLIGIMLSRLLPDNKNLYLNNVIVARKRSGQQDEYDDAKRPLYRNKTR